jgi:uncharacterized protein (DUF1499 family)
MIRRTPRDDPPSRLAQWAKRLALFGLALAAIDLVLVRGGSVDEAFGMLVLGCALGFAAAGVLLALPAFIQIWNTGRRGFGAALGGLLVGAGLLTYPAYVGARGYRLPPVSDVTTDAGDPPRFLVQAGSRKAEPPTGPVRDLAGSASTEFRDLTPLVVATSTAETYAGALEVVTRRKWRVVAARAPGMGRNGQIQAVAPTAVMGFPEDVVIRIRARGAGAVLDLRSAARTARRDFGSNVQRVRALRAEIEEEIGAQPDER